jgi:hypothetical protein
MRRHFSYANVVSTLCLLVLLGGTSYAAAQITGKDIKNSSLTGKDVKNGSLKGKDVKDQSVTGLDVSGLDASDLRAGAFPGARAERDTGTIPTAPTDSLDLVDQGYDTGDMYVPGDDFITIRKPGTYLIVGYVSWGDAGAGTRQLRINVDDVLRQVVVDHSTPDEYTQQVTTVQTLTAGQQVTLGAVSGLGSPAALSGFSGQAEISLTVQMVSP